jgi:hypothetical protein
MKSRSAWPQVSQWSHGEKIEGGASTSLSLQFRDQELGESRCLIPRFSKSRVMKRLLDKTYGHRRWSCERKGLSKKI